MEKALKIRNVFIKAFVLGYLVLIISSAVYYYNADWVIKLMEKIYKLSTEDSRMLIANAYILMKILIFTFFFIPAVAIHCEFSKCKCRLSKKNEK